MALKFVLAPDSFKGSATASEIAEAMEIGIRRIFTEAEFLQVPMADGGEGSTEAIVDSTDGEFIYQTVQGPLNDKVEARIGLHGDGETAVIEMATASGLELISKEERETVMVQTREVSKKEKIIFPIVVTVFVSLLIPSAASLIGMLMLGNLIRESEVVPLLADTLENSMMYIITILLGISVGASTDAEILLSKEALIIIVLGLFAFVIGTASGVLMGKLMYKLTGGKVNPLIGSAGVSAVPMAARVSQVEGIKANPNNYLLMHAMGPNVAGVIGSAIAAGILISFFG